jgi:hypothetical protein
VAEGQPGDDQDRAVSEGGGGVCEAKEGEMKHPTFDEAGYPSEDTLDAIHTWSGPWIDLVRFVHEAWLPGEGRSDLRTECWFLTRGRWKGNKHLVAALNANPGFRKFLARYYEEHDTYVYDVAAMRKEDALRGTECAQGVLFEEET